MLKIEHLKKSYESFSLDCSLEVKKGHVTGLIGQNGAGKSTTFKAILGLISFDSGTINILGKSLQDFTAKDKQDLGVVLSDSGFSGYLTINDIIPIIDNLYQNFDKSFFIEQVKKFQLPRNKRIKDFSTGMKAKVKVLVAVSHNAKLLILDEPTAGLDVIARDELLEMLRDFIEKDEERSILISSHISSDLETLCDTIRKAADFKLFQAAIEMFVHLPKKTNNHEQECYKEELWKYVRKYRLQIVTDHNCKLKYRILAFVSFFGQRILSCFFQFASRR